MMSSLRRIARSGSLSPWSRKLAGPFDVERFCVASALEGLSAEAMPGQPVELLFRPHADRLCWVLEWSG